MKKLNAKGKLLKETFILIVSLLITMLILNLLKLPFLIGFIVGSILWSIIHFNLKKLLKGKE